MALPTAVPEPVTHAFTSTARSWICAGSGCQEHPDASVARRERVVTTLGRLTSRVKCDTWVRYHIDLANTTPAPTDVSLTPVTNDVMATLRQHPDAGQNQLRSGFNFWDHGLQRAYIWLGDEGPLCMQWLLTEAENARMRSLPEWAGMYPPLSSRAGQVENLFAFSTARRKGVASQFEYALYEEARQLGLRELFTHIHASNAPARGWAERTGWRAFGSIRRCTFDFPRMRKTAVYLHRVGEIPGIVERRLVPR